MPKKILIIEDNREAREGMKSLLALEGFDTVAIKDGQEGLKMVRTERPDLIITDITMPGLDGIEMIKMLRKQPEFIAIPVIVLTAHGESKVSDAIRAGATRAVTKPVDVREFLSSIKQLLV
jgi:CheY-like chemotaxis protein